MSGDTTTAPTSRLAPRRAFFWFRIPLWLRILIGLLLGCGVGAALGRDAEGLKVLGDLFMQAIRMIVTPLIVTTLISGIAGLGAAGRLGKMGLRAGLLYGANTWLAVCLGMGFAIWLGAGTGVNLAQADATTLTPAPPLIERLAGLLPANPLEAIVRGDILSIVGFCILVGAAAAAAGERARPFVAAVAGGAEIMMQITRWIMEFAPIGVFGLAAWMVGAQDPRTFLSLLSLTAAVYAACLTHGIVICGFMIVALARLPVLPFMAGVLDVALMAFSTASSKATLPLSIKAAYEKLGVSRPAASALLPLGASINMDGTAAYLGACVIFAANVLQIELSWLDYANIALVAAVTSIGSGGVPAAALVLMPTVLSSIGVPPEQALLFVGLILPFDRPMDMVRTALNVVGDVAVATVVAKQSGEMNVAIYLGKERYAEAPDDVPMASAEVSFTLQPAHSALPVAATKGSS